jgi:flavin reductase (DIM6/NTAB) family NADH-FMN oxidoreductase RutF
MQKASHSNLDWQDYRKALGCFATGIAIVTASGPNEKHFGLTINSFSSVSLDPPLVLWSLQNNSPSLPIFKACHHFGISILREGQEEISSRFASKAENKFEGIEVLLSETGVPLISGALAHFECKNEIQHPGGDHLIFLGEVVHYQWSNGHPLLFYRGNYGKLAIAEHI